MKYTELVITSDFNDHVRNGRPGGVDFAKQGLVPLTFLEGGKAVYKIDQYGGNFVDVTNGNRMWRYAHMRNPWPIGKIKNVKAGEFMGYMGSTGWSTGQHVHIELWVNGKRIDPLPEIKRIESGKINLDIKTSNMETITVQKGWGLSHVAREAGYSDWSTQSAWERIYNLNQGHRGSANWQQLNARMGTGDILNVREKKKVEVPKKVEDNEEVKKLETELKKSQEQLQKAQKEFESKASNFNQQKKELEATQQAEMLKLEAESNERIEMLTKELEAEKTKAESLKNSISNFNNEDLEFFGDLAVKELEARGFFNKYSNLIDKFFKSKDVRSFFKYDVFVYIGAAISGISLTTLFPTLPTEITTMGTVVLGVIFKMLLTRYDRNKDGILDIRDTKSGLN